MEIYHMHKDELTDNFEENKKKVSEYTDIESGHIKNKIAGYLTKYVKRMQKKEAKEIQGQESVMEIITDEAEQETNR